MKPATTPSTSGRKSPKIIACVCQHTFQDSVYGKGQRVCNPMKTKDDTKTTYRCTVCGREHDK